MRLIAVPLSLKRRQERALAGDEPRHGVVHHVAGEVLGLRVREVRSLVLVAFVDDEDRSVVDGTVWLVEQTTGLGKRERRHRAQRRLDGVLLAGLDDVARDHDVHRFSYLLASSRLSTRPADWCGTLSLPEGEGARTPA